MSLLELHAPVNTARNTGYVLTVDISCKLLQRWLNLSTTNLIVHSRLGYDEKFKLRTKVNIEATVFSDLFKKLYLIKIFENQINF
jgi:hypothetical protein